MLKLMVKKTGEIINGEVRNYNGVKTKTKVPKPDEKADEIIFAVKWR